MGRQGVPPGRGRGRQSVRRRGRREDPRAGRQRDRRRGGDRLRAQRRRAAVGRHRRRRLHDDPPGRGPARRSAIDTREKAPAGATHDMFVGVPNSRRCRAWPSACRAWCAAPRSALERYGTPDARADVLQPAIKLADDGFAATPRYVRAAVAPAATAARRTRRESAAFFCPGGAAGPGRHAGARTSRWPRPSG